MTSKLPEVGQIFRYKNPTESEKLDEFEILRAEKYLITFVAKGWTCSNALSTSTFLRIFEPLPDQPTSAKNAQVPTTEKSSAVNSENLSKFDQDKVTRLEVIDDKGRSYTNLNVKDLKFSYQDEGRTLKIFCGKKPVEEEKKIDVSDTLKKLNTPWKDWRKPEPKSIWKPVSELPEDFFKQCLIKRRSGSIEIEILSGQKSYDNYDNKSFEPIAYCDITDLINSFEELEERVRKLEGKGK
jgi:hypothetical protein